MLDDIPQTTRQNAQGLNPLGLGFSVDQVSQAFHLSQVHPVVFQRTTGELSRFGDAGQPGR